jgi:hypothetical protein
MTLNEKLEEWLFIGRKRSATHMIVICDFRAQENYPAYVSLNEDVKSFVAIYEYFAHLKVVEVYSLRRDWKEQLSSRLAYNVN